MRQLTKDELEILRLHNMWRRDEPGGKRADLQGADLQGADLQRAYLQGAYLQRADLQGADLRGAYLQGADLQGADLQGADLQGADLQRADLQGADLQGADLKTVISQTQVCPQEGGFTAWKKGAGGHLIKLRIPSGAARLTAIQSRKCRASRVIVSAIWDAAGNRVQTCGGWHQRDFTYEVGKVVRPDSFDDDPRNECSHGIHFFCTREEAEAWS